MDNENQEDASASAAATIQTLQIAEAVKRIPGRENWQHIDHEIVFETGDIAPLSQKRFSFRLILVALKTAAGFFVFVYEILKKNLKHFFEKKWSEKLTF